MKKWCKRISCLLLLGILVFSFCGCARLDRMRQLQILREEDGSFYHKGVHYVALEANEYFNPANIDSQAYYLTEPDVPVLLSVDYAVGFLQFTEDGRFCRNYRQGMWFCDEEIYEEIQAKNREPFVVETYYYEYYIYPENHTRVLTPKELEAVNAVLASEPLVLEDGMYLSYDWGYTLIAASEDLLFSANGLTVCIAGSAYYLRVFDDRQEDFYKVPAEYIPIFDQISKEIGEAYGW